MHAHSKGWELIGLFDLRYTIKNVFLKLPNYFFNGLFTVVDIAM